MSETYSANDILNAIAAASKVLSSRKEEINRLNVFPVPDGDTGTNMSLTIESVVKNLAALPIGSTGDAARKAITTGALMCARQFGRYHLSDPAWSVRGLGQRNRGER